jgi:hypothetical protein
MGLFPFFQSQQVVAQALDLLDLADSWKHPTP